MIKPQKIISSLGLYRILGAPGIPLRAMRMLSFETRYFSACVQGRQISSSSLSSNRIDEEDILRTLTI